MSYDYTLKYCFLPVTKYAESENRVANLTSFLTAFRLHPWVLP